MSETARHLIQFLDEIARARGRMAVAFRDIRAMHGLTEVENVVLTAVTGARQLPTVPQIGRSLDHPRQVIQRAADALVARGLIEWHDNPDHKRARLLAPTEEGTRLRHLADLAGIARAEQLAEGIDADMLATVVAGLRTVRAAIQQNVRAIGETADADEQEDA
ncbi:MarR family winged helix-turn-helix transcriptional regulator [Sphingomonas immobilis]|uniref:MarR family transcriptional regulator n=1 Tax=Sphingomonas immobilis TaxID=3063997 RepID=A0ABT8ZXE1_9SPHN|nr:MarR family transcriptional regulator [Sphingomonas sp. CA1-15]MDO7842236.1 MarR family transcriptional regulator [Sphingomonas sp. CA1-15]